MRRVIVALAVCLWMAAPGAFVYEFRPRPTQIETTSYAFQTLSRFVTMEIKIGDQLGTVNVPIPYEVAKPVHHVAMREPTKEEHLRFWTLSIGVALISFYFAATILAYTRCLWDRTVPSKSLEIQLAGTVASLIGVFVGVAAVAGGAKQAVRGRPHLRACSILASNAAISAGLIDLTVLGG